ncbi:MAG: hypothetical protein Q7P63_11075 [Verrucomicrobiota bacterium JB022]|nr:hypothetical protein [Verrucomicrobiota bacterium JB022]
MLALAASVSAISFTFDYRYDEAGFFSGENAWRRAHIERAANVFEGLLVDDFSAIQTGGSNQYEFEVYDVDTFESVYIPGFDLRANEILVFVGATDYPGQAAARGGWGLYRTDSTDPDFLASLDRGQANARGDHADEFGVWGGMITFDTSEAWYFDDDVSTIEPFPDQLDFYSTTLHELGHVLGLGTADSWYAQKDENFFYGEAAMELFGGPVPLDDDAHWKEDLISTTLAGDEQFVLVDPWVIPGLRKELTLLDLAGMEDLGWEIRYPVQVPEPQTVAFLGGLAGLALAAGRRRRG